MQITAWVAVQRPDAWHIASAVQATRMRVGAAYARAFCMQRSFGLRIESDACGRWAPVRRQLRCVDHRASGHKLRNAAVGRA